MIGDEEAALWHRATESTEGLAAYRDWLVTHDPARGELLASRMQRPLTHAEDERETALWRAALDLPTEAGVVCRPLPTVLVIDAMKIAALEPVLDRFPFLWINLVFDPDHVADALALPAIAKIRRLGYTAVRYEYDNYQSDPRVSFSFLVVPELCAAPNLAQLEGLRLDDEPGRGCADLVARGAFEALRELSITGYIGDEGALALARMTKLASLSLQEHGMGPRGVAALRVMPAMKHLVIDPPVADSEPTMTLDACAICRHLPARCDRQTVSSMVADYDVDYGDERGYDHVPPQVAQLEVLLEKTRDEGFTSEDSDSLGGWSDRTVLRCPTCHRVYLLVERLDMIGARNYHTWTYERLDIDGT